MGESKENADGARGWEKMTARSINQYPFHALTSRAVRHLVRTEKDGWNCTHNKAK